MSSEEEPILGIIVSDVILQKDDGTSSWLKVADRGVPGIDLQLLGRYHDVEWNPCDGTLVLHFLSGNRICGLKSSLLILISRFLHLVLLRLRLQVPQQRGAHS